MKNFLEDYLKQKHLQSEFTAIKPGPVVTLSREYGCEAKLIAKQLAKELNTSFLGIGQDQKWEMISKEILDESARELQTETKKIEYIFGFEKRTSIDDFFISMTSRYYQSDWKIREAVKHVVRAFAFKGNAIIVGRAGAQITRDIKNTLHIKLVASFDWRVNHVKEKYQIPEKEAVKQVKEMDQNRAKLFEMFKKGADCNYCYDVYFNLEHLSNAIIVSDIIHLMQLKKLV